MKILAPTNSPKEAEELILAGADELYCGVLSDEWAKRFTNIGSANRREFKRSNLKNFDKLRKLIRISKKYNVPVYLALNAFYSEEMYPLIVNEAIEAANLGVSAFIVADYNLMLQLKHLPVDLHISTGATCFNTAVIEFYKNAGATRVILPRHVTIKEINNLADNGIETEIFAMNTRCMNIDGFCTYQHGLSEQGMFGNLMKKVGVDEIARNMVTKSPGVAHILNKTGQLCNSSACCLMYNVSGGPVQENSYIASQFGASKMTNHCGACMLNKVKGITSLKIVGRQKATDKKKRDIFFLKELIHGFQRNDYEDFAIETFQETYGFDCKKELCYYGKSNTD